MTLPTPDAPLTIEDQQMGWQLGELMREYTQQGLKGQMLPEFPSIWDEGMKDATSQRIMAEHRIKPLNEAIYLINNPNSGFDTVGNPVE